MSEDYVLLANISITDEQTDERVRKTEAQHLFIT